MNYKLPALNSVFALLIVVMGHTLLLAARDDEAPPPPEKNQQNQLGMQVAANFDQWVFQGSGSADASRQQIKARLNLQLDELERICNLTKDQKQKLALAASGDTKRFFDQVDDVRKKFLAKKNDENAMGQIWQDIHPLQSKLAAGLFGNKSLFAKTVYKTLDAQQIEKYKAVVDERRRFRYGACIETALATLAKHVALRHQQREALIKLLVEETQPPEAFGQYDYYYVINSLSKLGANKVKPLLDERQWKLLQQQFNQVRGMEPFLVQNGVIVLEN